MSVERMRQDKRAVVYSLTREAGQDRHSKQMTPNESTCDSCATLRKMYMGELELKERKR